MDPIDSKARFRGIVIGTAVGDALGLPAEGISPRRIKRLWPGRWQHRLILRKGLMSDDTEHTAFTSLALLADSVEPDKFARCLAWHLRWWLLSLPAGVGLATGRAIIKLWLGFGPRKSGVFSAGNGPAMRVAPISAFFAHQQDRLQEFVRASTQLTHTDPRALTGALAVSNVIAWVCRDQPEALPAKSTFLEIIRSADPEGAEWREIVAQIDDILENNLSVKEFAGALGCDNGVSGYVFHTVPVALYAWYRHFGDFEKTLAAVLDCGGDTDTVGAITGALAGAVTGEQGIPAQWIGDIIEWPRSVSYLRKLADQLAEKQQTGRASSEVRYFWPAVVLRNILFLIIVLGHGFRRLLPPY